MAEPYQFLAVMVWYALNWVVRDGLENLDFKQSGTMLWFLASSCIVTWSGKNALEACLSMGYVLYCTDHTICYW